MDSDAPNQPAERFSPATAGWFAQAFEQPTAVQAQAWQAIATGEHSLVVAPTGSGKTLAAFLSAVDDIITNPYTGPKQQRCRVLYISPLRALASDVARNLTSPIVGINRVRQQLGQPPAEVTVAIRSSDTSASQRRSQAQTPPDILITTPESLFLLLTSQARESLRGITSVIIDEIHAVAGSKRGAHLAVSLDRLDALLAKPAQRIGLSATVEPITEVARFLGGGAPVTVVHPPSFKSLELRIEVPVADLAAPDSSPGRADDAGRALDEDARAPEPSIWPHMENRIVDLIEAHRSTLVFANSRRLAERLTARLNEIAAARAEVSLDDSVPADFMAQAGQSQGAGPIIARAHHGSVSKEQRADIEEALKAGEMPAVVATSSLELGIDMGAIDLVVQVEAPASVSSGLQRVGRAGHQVGETSRAILFPKHRGDLLTTTVVTKLMSQRQLEPLHVPTNPLDVLAQQIIACVAMDDELDVPGLFDLFRRSASFHSLSRNVFESVLDMLAGRYPSDEFSELRPRLVWDRHADTLTARPGAQRIAVTSGGTIPDRGLFAVFMVGEKQTRVGELDEEMVYESRVGDVFALGTSSWRIEDITADRVLVSPAPGRAGKLPFWHGDALGRPPEVGVALGELLTSLQTAPPQQRRKLLADIGLDKWACDNLLCYVAEQVEATHILPTHQNLVIERFRDELGDWRVVLHSPFGARVNAPWALAASIRLETQTGLDAQVMHADDGIVMRLPDTEDDAAVDLAISCLLIDPEDVRELVTASLGSSALFASRFRECAARALLLPRRDPGRRTPLWQQRQRSAQLLSIVAKYPQFPIVLETVRECMQDVYDITYLERVLCDIESRKITITHSHTSPPSPFARSLLFNYVASFLYEGDSPLAERRAAALTLDTELLAELFGHTPMRDLLDAEAITQVAEIVGYLTDDRHATNIEQAADILRILGPLDVTAAQRRGIELTWLADLVRARRAIDVRIAGIVKVAAIEDAARLRDALGVALPVGVPDAFLTSVEEPLLDLVARYARTHGPFTTADVADEFGIGVAVAHGALARLAADQRVVSGEFTPDTTGHQWCDVNVLRRLRRATIAALRQEVEAVPPHVFGKFLCHWQHIDRPLRGIDGLYEVISQLTGYPIAASLLETMILPTRVSDYHPSMLDELIAIGDVVWTGHSELATDDGWLYLATARDIDLLPAHAPVAVSADLARVRQVLAGGGAWLASEISERTGMNLALTQSVLWQLVWSGAITSDTFAPVRALLTRNWTRATRGATRAGPGSRRRIRAVSHTARNSALNARQSLGRWSLLQPASQSDTEAALRQADLLSDRYGIVARAVTAAEPLEGGFTAIYRTFAAMEDLGKARRGYFIEGLGAAQFASAGAVDQLRAMARDIDGGSSTAKRAVAVLAATDPANPYGAALGWPELSGGHPIAHRPGRKVGAVVVLVDGKLACYLEKGGKTCLVYDGVPTTTHLAVGALASAVRAGRVGKTAITKINGMMLVQSPLRDQFEQAGFALSPKGLVVRSVP